jgi:hypothetical protein
VFDKKKIRDQFIIPTKDSTEKAINIRKRAVKNEKEQ